MVVVEGKEHGKRHTSWQVSGSHVPWVRVGLLLLVVSHLSTSTYG